MQLDSFDGATYNKNGPMSTATLLADEHTAPPTQEVGTSTDLVPAFTGITDSFDTTKESITILGPLQWIAICLRRIIPVGTDSHISAQYRIIIETRS
jgi:hypothetical protein